GRPVGAPQARGGSTWRSVHPRHGRTFDARTVDLRCAACEPAVSARTRPHRLRTGFAHRPPSPAAWVTRQHRRLTNGCGSSGGTERDCTAVPASVGDDFGTSDEFWSWVTGYLSSLVSRTHHRAPAPPSPAPGARRGWRGRGTAGDEFWSWVTGYLSSLVSRTHHRAPAPPSSPLGARCRWR